MPWSVFFNRDIGIHGTYEIASLGRAVSHGCVRLHPGHAETFFRWVQEVGKPRTRIIVQQ
jgi:lipoprotein-anchoring transpeptidase ErfK/SrfK